MSVTINCQEIPRNSLHTVSLEPDGTAHISGEIVNEDYSKVISIILYSLKDGDGIEFDIEDKDPNRLNG